MSVIVSADTILKGVTVHGALNDQTRKILSKEALKFLTLLHRSFNERRKELLARRQIRQKELDKGATLDFLPGACARVRLASSFCPSP